MDGEKEKELVELVIKLEKFFGVKDREKLLQKLSSSEEKKESLKYLISLMEKKESQFPNLKKEAYKKVLEQINNHKQFDIPASFIKEDYFSSILGDDLSDLVGD